MAKKKAGKKKKKIGKKKGKGNPFGKDKAPPFK